MTETIVCTSPLVILPRQGYVCRRGKWVEADPNGVMCPFCGAWENLPEPTCPNRDCGALLDGIVYQRELRKSTKR